MENIEPLKHPLKMQMLRLTPNISTPFDKIFLRDSIKNDNVYRNKVLLTNNILIIILNVQYFMLESCFIFSIQFILSDDTTVFITIIILIKNTILTTNY